MNRNRQEKRKASLRKAGVLISLCLVYASLSFCFAQDAANVDIDGSTEYQTIIGLGGLMETHAQIPADSGLWDLLFDEVGVSSLYIVPFVNHKLFDEEELFPMLREAKDHGVQNIHVEYLSHPVEWKDENHYLREEYHENWAYKILEYIAYLRNAADVQVTSFSPFAEPSIGQDPPISRCRITKGGYIRFLKTAGPIFRNGAPEVKIYAPSNYFIQLSITWSSVLFSDPVVHNYIDVVSTHGYDWEKFGRSTPGKWRTLVDLARSHNKSTALTETCHHPNPDPHPAGLLTAKWIHHAFVDGGAIVFHWWLMLDKGHYDTRIRGFVYSKDWPPGEFTADGITKYGYAFKQYARWVKPGAVRLEASSNHSDLLVSCFKHPTQNTFTVVVINDASEAKQALFRLKNLQMSNLDVYRTSLTENSTHLGQVSAAAGSFYYTFPDESITTFTSGGEEIRRSKKGKVRR